MYQAHRSQAKCTGRSIGHHSACYESLVWFDDVLNVPGADLWPRRLVQLAGVPCRLAGNCGPDPGRQGHRSLVSNLCFCGHGTRGDTLFQHPACSSRVLSEGFTGTAVRVNKRHGPCQVAQTRSGWYLGMLAGKQVSGSAPVGDESKVMMYFDARRSATLHSQQAAGAMLKPLKSFKLAQFFVYFQC